MMWSRLGNAHGLKLILRAVRVIANSFGYLPVHGQTVLQFISHGDLKST